MILVIKWLKVTSLKEFAIDIMAKDQEIGISLFKSRGIYKLWNRYQKAKQIP
jgi:hypothetical protein